MGKYVLSHWDRFANGFAEIYTLCPVACSAATPTATYTAGNADAIFPAGANVVANDFFTYCYRRRCQHATRKVENYRHKDLLK